MGGRRTGWGLALLLLAPGGLRGDDAPARAVEAFIKAGVRVLRDEQTPGKPVVGIDFTYCDFDAKAARAALKELAAFPDLQALELGQRELTAADLSTFAALKKL